ncbi:hypothetical protein Zmor_018435 [Zophobas morio]|uniref:Gustatory receptor n=1 Tax=Zophobas morio TaxID=2755281 RepID=A0AA38IC97_9CUCU|nr:hypothetical protein Zmor_018435 [Zophobas morio]
MSVKQLQILFNVGKILAITPASFRGKNTTLSEKLYGCFMIIFYTVAVIVSFVYRVPQYKFYIHIKLAIHVILDILLYLFCIQTITSALLKRELWCVLIQNLKITGNGSVNKFNYGLRFFIGNIIFWIMNIYLLSCFTYYFGLEFVKQYSVDTLQVYVQFNRNFLIWVFLKFFKSRYRAINRALLNLKKLVKRNHETSINDTLRRLRYNFVLLENTIHIFNAIFGWTILISTLHGSLQMIIYFDNMLIPTITTTVTLLVANFLILLLYWTGTATIIIICDDVLDEAEQTVVMAYKLQKKMKFRYNLELTKLITVVTNNFPRFSAAGFFVINKSTILKIFDAIVTLLVVVIQFDISESYNFAPNYFVNKTVD